MSKVFPGQYVKVNCRCCNKSFMKRKAEFIKYPNSYCSYDCMYVWKKENCNIVLTCQSCGKEYVKKKSLSTISKYCSNKCKSDAWRVPKNTCVDCGVEISSTIAERCMPCARLHLAQTREPKIKKIGYITIICDYCTKEHQQKRTNYDPKGKHHYCNKKCEGLHRRQISPHGKDHWKYTTSLTPMFNHIRLLAQYKDWRKEVFNRDDYSCQICGEQGYIQAHHIKSVKQILMDNNITTSFEAKFCKELWEVDNGITYCINCHKEEHRKERLAC